MSDTSGPFSRLKLVLIMRDEIISSLQSSGAEDIPQIFVWGTLHEIDRNRFRWQDHSVLHPPSLHGLVGDPVPRWIPSRAVPQFVGDTKRRQPHSSEPLFHMTQINPSVGPCHTERAPLLSQHIRDVFQLCCAQPHFGTQLNTSGKAKGEKREKKSWTNLKTLSVRVLNNA